MVAFENRRSRESGLLSKRGRSESGCQEICLESIGHYLELGGKHATPEHIRMLME
jgi:hypothetical protein